MTMIDPKKPDTEKQIGIDTKTNAFSFTMPIAEEPVKLVIRPDIQNQMSPQAERVVEIVLEALALFLEKNRGYGNTSEHLGARGQYADMHRKMGKLKHTLWDGSSAVGESIEEMCMDLIGHAALTINFLRGEDR